MRIGHYKLKNNLFLAPMAGVTDRPFRGLCRRLGAGMAASEMVSSNSLLWGSEKTKRRADHTGEEEPRAVQIVGSDPALMAQAGRYNTERGAQIIDINMGCPAKKICNVYAGSALMQNEKLVAEILQAVVKSVDVPVTLKIRTGWDSANRNGPAIARISGDCQRRHRHAREGRLRAPAHGRRWPDDRPRGPGGSLDFPGNLAFSGHRRETRPAPGHGSARHAARTPGYPVRVLRRIQRRAHGAQAHLLVQQGPARWRGLPSRGKCGRDHDRAACDGARIF